METTLSQTPWSGIEKMAFRFFFIFFLLFIVVHNNGTYPYFWWVMIYPTEWLHLFIPWLGKNVLHLPYDITAFTMGSGDTTYDYVLLLTSFVIAISGATIWTAIDRKRINYTTLYYWLTVAVRFYVGLMLINYGMVKVFKLQFQYPSLNRLLQPYGNSSPMGLAWTFLGFSKGYNMFMGVAEILGVLLLFRRTMTAGAIIALMTSANVMAVNYCYDVPVKIVSTMLVAMCLFLLARDLKRLLRFFFSGQSENLPVISPPVMDNHWFNYGFLGFKILLIGYVFIFGIIQARNSERQFGSKAPKPPLFGLYSATTFVRGTDTLPPLITDSVRWRNLFVERPGFARVKFMNDSSEVYVFNPDTVRRTIVMVHRSDTARKHHFTYEKPDKDHLVMTGRMNKDSIRIYFDRSDASKFRLMNRGFHWISEYPYNK